ncbi:MAG: TIGR03936 family radical SAM-associated protein [Clostridiales Family XIII bacterium]|jgi:radical SAM-linked protein|nr:TIGR03936 family radical SAM-associated protein [Clostridiales Family XIII bacterium]
MKLVFEFTKTGNLVYISHLDLARLFLRALRMSGQRPAYSHGFNPHPKMSFALPLPLGLHSTCELLEFETDAGAEGLDGVMMAVNARLPEGMRVTACFEKPGDIPKSLASYAAASAYEFMCEGVADAPALLASFFAQGSVRVMKKDKKTGAKSEKEIRPEMIGCRIVKDIRGRMLAETTLAAAPGQTLNPLVFFGAFCGAAGLDPEALSPIVTRTAILGADGRPLTAMLSGTEW